MIATAFSAHADFCGWHVDQYPWECDCGAILDPGALRKPVLSEQPFRPYALDAYNDRSTTATRLVIVESAYAGDIERNVAYARAAMADCLKRGEAPIASHLLYTQPGVLDDAVPQERKIGIDAGLAWGRAADGVVFYVDLGWSRGMVEARQRHAREYRPREYRRLPGWAL